MALWLLRDDVTTNRHKDGKVVDNTNAVQVHQAHLSWLHLYGLHSTVPTFAPDPSNRHLRTSNKISLSVNYIFHNSFNILRHEMPVGRRVVIDCPLGLQNKFVIYLIFNLWVQLARRRYQAKNVENIDAK